MQTLDEGSFHETFRQAGEPNAAHAFGELVVRVL
jgi:hypothetical protein